MPLGFKGSTRLPANLKFKLIHHSLNRLWRTWMFLGMVEDDRQHEGTGMLFDRHPFMGEHHARAASDKDHMMIVIDELLCLLASADRNSLVWIDPVERGHAVMLPPTLCSRMHPDLFHLTSE